MRKIGHHAIGFLKAAVPMATLIVLALIINQQGSNYLRREAERNLVSLLNVITASVETEYRQAIANAQFIAAQPEVVDATRLLLEARDSRDSLLASPGQKDARAYLAPMLDIDLYQGFFIIGPENISLASSRDANVGTPNLLAEQHRALQLAWAGQSLMTGPRLSDVPLRDRTGKERPGAPTAFAVSPIRDPDGKMLALLALRLDPQLMFYSTLQAGMTGRSGESYMFDRSGVMLSESRFTTSLWESGRLPQGEASFHRLTLTRPGTVQLTRPTDAATQGIDGVDVDGYQDYRGVEVVGAWRWLRALDIGVAVEIDAEEIFAGAQLLQTAVFGITVVAAALLVIIAEMTGIQRRRL